MSVKTGRSVRGCRSETSVATHNAATHNVGRVRRNRLVPINHGSQTVSERNPREDTTFQCFQGAYSAQSSKYFLKTLV